MEEKINTMLEKISSLVQWTRELKSLQENPYISNFNVTKMLEDLNGFALGLHSDATALKSMVTPPNETNLDSVEQ